MIFIGERVRLYSKIYPAVVLFVQSDFISKKILNFFLARGNLRASAGFLYIELIIFGDDFGRASLEKTRRIIS